ncbi:MAG: PilZ domain-containing protein [Gammaproteobacteria bacterium]
METERRSRRRIALANPVLVSADDSDETLVYRTHDFSMSGMSFYSDYPYPVGGVVKMSMNIAPRGKSNIMHVLAEVVRIDTDGEQFINGLRFRRKYK